MKKWEYYSMNMMKVTGIMGGVKFEIDLADGTTHSGEELLDILTQLGEEGWELVDTANVMASSGTVSIMFFFKRELENG